MAGRADFSDDEWTTIRRAMIAAGVIVSRAVGGGGDVLSEVLAVTQVLRAARIGHPNQLVRELADIPSFQSGVQPGMSREQYERPALETIRVAVALLHARSPVDLPPYRAFLVELCKAAANAHVEGRVLGLGGVRISPGEAAAIARVKKALGIS